MPDACVDLLFADLPYGTTACKWDSVIPFERLWPEFNRICKPNAAMVFTASQPFTSFLLVSNADNYKHRWVWDKLKPGSGLMAKKKPLKNVEDILVFCQEVCTYFPQMTPKKPRAEKKFDRNGAAFGDARVARFHDNGGFGYPKEILQISNANQNNRIHPTQKPVELLEYMIKTYTKEGDFVFDPTAGSLTTGVAAENLGRRWACAEQLEEYFEKGLTRFTPDKLFTV